MMSSTRWAGSGLMFLGACFVYAMGCSSSSSTGNPGDGGTTATTGSGTTTGSTLVTGTGITGVTGTAATGATVGSGGAGGSTGTGTGTGGAGGTGGGTGVSKLGSGCKADADCGGGGLTCTKGSDNLSAVTPGGPGNGLCTLDCTMNQSACAPLGGTCVAIDVDATGTTVSKALCFEGCSIGPNPPAAPVAKCHSREDVVCEPVNQAETLFACVPLCVTDADCGTRKCEPSSGLCVDTPMPGKALGAGCTVVRGMTNTECAGGLCLPVTSIPDGGTSAPGICTALCRLGTQEACNFRITPIDAGPPVGSCVFPWGDTGYNNGDLGLCLQLCDSTADCGYKAADWVCRTDLMLTGTGHSVCLVPPAG